VIEEAPAPGMDDATREAICAAAVRAAKAVDYVGAGTIEFIADASEGLKAERVFFMEMNTRLQVEHPVTEEITGVDLVEWQLRVASGEPLPLKQEELEINGHAIEARLYAEDPAKGFLPSTGRLEYFRLPTSIRPTRWQDQAGLSQELSFGQDVRIETGVEEGDVISPFYDPMIAKLVCHAGNRLEALIGVAKMCADSQVWPVKSNAAFLHSLAVNPDFHSAKIDTSFIAEHEDDLALGDEPAPDWLLSLSAKRLAPSSPGPTAFRLNATPSASVVLSVDRKSMIADLGQAVSYDQEVYPIIREADGVIVATLSGQTWKIGSFRAEGAIGSSAHDGDIFAPMPGKVIAVDVAEGQSVEAGQRLMVLEAMKMEHALTAPFAGTVAELSAHEGQQVQVEALLARVVKAADGGGLQPNGTFAANPLHHPSDGPPPRPGEDFNPPRLAPRPARPAR
jgi:3-methylcrotonyl-CoA carboxylase alpha subunit